MRAVCPIAGLRVGMKTGDRDTLARTREPDQSKWVMPQYGG